MIIQTRKGFTIIEMMIVLVIISILSVVLISNLRMFINNTREKKVRSDLQVLKKGILIYRNQYGYWPDDPAEVVDRGLVNWDGSNRKYEGKLINGFGYTYDIFKNIRGHSVRTFYDDPRKGQIEVYQRFTPPYKASKNGFTFFYNNFELLQNGDFLADYPIHLGPYAQTNVSAVPGFTSIGQGCSFNNGYLIYEQRVSSFDSITIEFWAKFNNTNPSGTVVHLAGKAGYDTREIEVYFHDTLPRLGLQITSLYAEDDFADNELMTWVFESAVNQTWNTTDWYHFAFVYSSDELNQKSEVKIFQDGVASTWVNVGPGVPDYFPLEIEDDMVTWEPYIYIGTDRDISGAGLNNVVLDNLMLSYTKKNEGDFKP